MGIKMMKRDMDRVVKFFREREARTDNQRRLKMLWKRSRFEGGFALVPSNDFVVY